jgi:outer membrane lipoprotein-sorting protein
LIKGQIIAACLLVILCSAVYATNPEGAPGREIAARLALHDIVQGQFEQWRGVEGLSKPLASTGRFFFWRERGIYWSTETPVKQALTYRNDKTLQWQPGAETPLELRSPGDAHFRRMLLAIFSFNLEQLANQFELRWLGQEASWQVDLLPRKRSVQRALRQVSLRGSEYVEQLVMTDVAGQVLRIDFSAVATPPAIGLLQCADLFAWSPGECKAYGAAGSP